MDCVTCLLMGMCVLCGHNFGGSGVQTLTDTGAASPGRSMTKAEVDSALQTALKHFNTGTTNTNSYRRQSKLDPKYGQMGIGKRRGPKLDPYNFSTGLGKRNFQEIPEAESEFDPKFDDPNEFQYAAANPNIPRFSENARDIFDFVSSQPTQYLLSKYLLSLSNTKSSEEFLKEEKEKLHKRRQRQRLGSLIAMSEEKR